MSTMKKFPQRPMPTKFNAPRVTVDTENTGKLMSLVQQGNFGEIYNVIGSMAVDVNIAVDDEVLINAIIEVSPEQVSEERKLELIDYLVTHNQLSINIHGKHDLTPVHIACKEGYELILDYLLKHGANVDSTNDLGMTPMHYATLINLKSCPDPKTPGPLLKKRQNTGAKVSDITKKMMELFLDEGINSIEDENTTQSSMITKFKEDIKILERAYTAIVTSYVEKNIDENEVASLMSGSKTDDIIETTYKDAVKNLSHLEYPNNIITKTDFEEIDEIIEECRIQNSKKLLKFIRDEIVNVFHENLFETVKREISEYLKEKEKYINEVIKRDVIVFKVVFEKEDNMFRGVKINDLIKQLVCDVDVLYKYLPDLIRTFERKKYDSNTPEDIKIQIDVTNFCKLFIPTLEWENIGTIFDNEINNRNWGYNKIGTLKQTPIQPLLDLEKIAAYSFIQVAQHYKFDLIKNYNDFIKKYVLDYVQYLSKDITFILAYFGNNFHKFTDDVNNRPNNGIIPPRPPPPPTNPSSAPPPPSSSSSSAPPPLSSSSSSAPPPPSSSSSSAPPPSIMTGGSGNVMPGVSPINSDIKSKNDFYFINALTNGRENLINASINIEQQQSDVRTYLLSIQKTLMFRLSIIERINKKPYNDSNNDFNQEDFKEIINAKDNGLLEGIVESREQFLYKTLYPYTFHTLNFKNKPPIKKDNAKLSIIERIASIENIDISKYDLQDNPIEKKTSEMKTKYSQNVYIGIVNTTYDKLLRNIRQNDTLNTEKYNYYYKLKDEFKDVEKINANPDSIIDAVTTFNAFILTMQMRYFYNFNGKFYDPTAGATNYLVDLPNPGAISFSAVGANNITLQQRMTDMIDIIKGQYIINDITYDNVLSDFDTEHSDIKKSNIIEYMRSFDKIFVNNNTGVAGAAGAVAHQQIRPANLSISRDAQNNIVTSNRGPLRNYIDIERNFTLINIIIVKSAYNMIVNKYSNIDKDYLKSVLIQSTIQLSNDINPPNVVGQQPQPQPQPIQNIITVLNTSYIDEYRDLNNFKSLLYDKIELSIKNSNLLTMQLYTFPFSGYDDRTMCTSFFRDITNLQNAQNPVKYDAYAPINEVSDITIYTLKNNLQIFDVFYNNLTPGPNITNSKLSKIILCLQSMRKSFISNITKRINTENVKNYKNIFSGYKLMALYTTLFFYMTIQNDGNSNIEYLTEMYSIKKEMNSIVLPNPTMSSTQNDQIVDILNNYIVDLIDEKRDIIIKIINDINTFVDFYSEDMPLNDRIYSLILDLKKCYNLFNAFSFVDIRRKEYIKEQLDNHSMGTDTSYIDSTSSNSILHTHGYEIGQVEIPNYFKDVERIILTLQSKHYFLLTYKTFFEKYYDIVIENNSESITLLLYNNIIKDIIKLDYDSLQIDDLIDDFINNCKDVITSDDNGQIIQNVYMDLVKRLDIAKEKHMIFQFQCGRRENDIIKFKTETIMPDNPPMFLHFNMLYDDIKDMAEIFYRKTVYNYKVSDPDSYELPNVNPETKNIFLKSHMMSIYEKFAANYIRQYMLFIIKKLVTEKITGEKLVEKGAFNPSPSDLEVDLTKINSSLVKYITTNDADVNALGPEEFDVKLIEDEEYDIYATKDNVIKVNGEEIYIFYSFDYFSKQTSNICLSINTKIIEKLLENNASLSVQDTNDMTPIKYIIEGRMYYLIRSNAYIRKACLESENMSTIINYEQRHNALYYDNSNFFYKNKTYAMIQKFEKELIRKLKASESVENNIPINIKYVFWTFTALQNIYWYRRMNKQSDVDNDYGNLYKETYVKYDAIGDILDEYNWRNFNVLTVATERDSVGKVKKFNSKIIRSNEIPEDQTVTDTKKDQLEKITNDKIESTTVPIVLRIDGDIELFKYYEDLYSQFSNKPILYTAMWKELYDKYILYTSTDESNFLIHHQLQKTYNDKLNNVIIEKENVSLLDGYIYGIDEVKKRDLITESVKLDKIFVPISEYIDDRLLPSILDNNRMLLTQVRILCHILSTFLGSHLITYCRTLLYKQISRHAGEGINVTYDDIEKITKPLKSYVCSTEDIDGKLSYDFLKAHMRFKKAEEDEYTNEATNMLFMNFGSKFDDSELASWVLPNKDTFIESLNISMASYYHTLYKEITNTLLEYSDSYYRFIKNQHLGIKCIASLQDTIPP